MSWESILSVQIADASGYLTTGMDFCQGAQCSSMDLMVEVEAAGLIRRQAYVFNTPHLSIILSLKYERAVLLCIIRLRFPTRALPLKSTEIGWKMEWGAVHNYKIPRAQSKPCIISGFIIHIHSKRWALWHKRSKLHREIQLAEFRSTCKISRITSWGVKSSKR